MANAIGFHWIPMALATMSRILQMHRQPLKSAGAMVIACAVMPAHKKQPIRAQIALTLMSG